MTTSEAYLARPSQDGARGGVGVIHHLLGYDRAAEEIVRRFAELGYNAIFPNLYWREAPGADPADAAATARAHGGFPDERLVGDVSGAALHLRSLPGANGRVGVIGYCSGGRQSVLAACRCDLDAAVDCYGAFVVGTPREGFPLKVTNLVDPRPQLRAPLLGRFGNEGSHPSPEQVNELDEILTSLDKPHEFIAMTTPDTGDSPWTVPPTASRRPTTAGNGSSPFTRPTSEADDVHVHHDHGGPGRECQGTRRQLVSRHRRDRVLRSSRARDGRAHAHIDFADPPADRRPGSRSSSAPPPRAS